jgi:hypothetical protein
LTNTLAYSRAVAVTKIKKVLKILAVTNTLAYNIAVAFTVVQSQIVNAVTN